MHPEAMAEHREPRVEADPGDGETEMELPNLVSTLCQFPSVAAPVIFALILAWRFEWYSGGSRSEPCSAWEFSLWLGFDIGFVSVIAAMVSLLPSMIMTWTTALLFEMAFERRRMCHRDMVVKEGRRLAKEIYFSTLKNVLSGSKFLAALVTVACLILLLFRGIDSAKRCGSG